LPYFASHPLDAITYDTVETYVTVKLAEKRPLSARSINMTVTLLGAILERAMERGLISTNPARGKDRKAKEDRRPRTHLDSTRQIEALLSAAGELDREATNDRRHIARKAMIATLCFSGLRIDEMLSLRWRNVDLVGGWLTVAESKTPTGRRKVKIRGALHAELHSAISPSALEPDAFVFPTRTGRQLGPDNFRNRVLARAVKRANEKLEKAKEPPLPPKLTPHGLRHTFCSLLYAVGEDARTVMAELGHSDPALSLRVYAHSMRYGEKEREQLRRLIEGAEWTGMDGNGASRAHATNGNQPAEPVESAIQGA
jgi:integrase